MSRVKDFQLPDLGEGLTEGEILKWLVGVGDTVTLNQPIVEVETAKAAVEIPAKWAGKVVAIHHPEGTTVAVGATIISIDTDPTAGDLPPPDGQAADAGPQPGDGPSEPGIIGGPAPGGRTAVLVGYGPRTGATKRRPRKPAANPPASATPAPLVAAPVVTAPVSPAPPVTVPARPVTVPAQPAAPAPRATDAARVLAKPPVRKLARDLGVDLAGLVGSGPQGSITREDVLAAAARATGTAAPAAAPAFGPDREQRIPIKGVQKVMAENMVASAFTAPHVTMFLNVDMTRAMQALDRLRDLPDWREMRVSPLLLIAKACLLAIKRHPMINSTWSAETNEIIVKEYVNLGIAAATERGLVVPNIKDAGRLSLRELAEAMSALVTTARAGRTAPADMAGGTFTITNVGVFGVDGGTPILPPGEAAILAVGAVREMPWVHDGELAVRQVAMLSLSFDHRVVDGELGGKFLRDVVAFLADPEVALLAWT